MQESAIWWVRVRVGCRVLSGIGQWPGAETRVAVWAGGAYEIVISHNAA
jgi:hypothetical protein